MADPSRIKPPLGPDNAWWWQMADQGKLGIQRCLGCDTLRHPPRPMCGECQSIEWDFVESTLEGEVYSFVVLHYPEIPGYDYPLVSAIISLKEGTRLLSNVIDCDPSDVYNGAKVSGEVIQVDDKTVLPQFKLVKE